MAGIIQDVKSSQPAQGGVTPQALRAKMQIPPQLQGQYQSVVAAGRKIMYSPQMGGQIQQLLQGPGTMGDKLGQGVLALIAILLDKTNRGIPPQLIIPAAIELVAEAGDFLSHAGVKVTDQDKAQGVSAVIQQILQKSGVSMDQLPALLKQQQQGAPAPAGA
jgi:hypothetical protein